MNGAREICLAVACTMAAEELRSNTCLLDAINEAGKRAFR